MPHELLASHICSRLGYVPDRLEEVLAAFSLFRADRNELLLAPGEVCRYVYFVARGGLYVFSLQETGLETVRSFYLEESWVTDIHGFQQQFPAREGIRALEPATLLRISFEDFQRLGTEVSVFGLFYRKLLETSYTNTVYRINTLLGMDALARYKWLMENQPRLLTRVSSRLVASYLGIAPETFTRLKGKA